MTTQNDIDSRDNSWQLWNMKAKQEKAQAINTLAYSWHLSQRDPLYWTKHAIIETMLCGV